MASTANKWEPLPPDKSSKGPTGNASADPKTTYEDQADVPLDGEGRPIDLLALIGRAEQLSKDFQLRTIEAPLARAYRAWQNKHAENSKYLGPAFKGRSRLFVPKTRSAVRKNLATAAAALFSNNDVVNVAAAYDDDEKQKATADVMKAVLEYRLTRSSTRSGIPWFQISMGACQDSQITGVSISKQYWQYEEVPTTKTVMLPLLDEATGAPIVGEDGAPVLYEQQVEDRRVVFDRPMVELKPIEDALIDPSAPWYAPEQLGRWFSMRYPIGLSDVKSLLASPGKGGADPGWIKVDDALLMKGRLDDDRSNTRRAREGGPDRFQDGRGTNDLDIIWIQENFLRISGIDYTWWSIGRFGFISKVRETRAAYPEFDGERPYIMGFAQIDAHRIFPMSPVESWQPLQLELNDITNLRQDTLKRSIAPLALVQRGRNVDMSALQRRGQPETVVLMDDIEKDVKLMETRGPPGTAYTETSVNNAMFDELAGVFSTSSVQANRQLNETVGGMKLMSGAANSVSEFDLRTWVETYVERVLRQVMHLIRYYEDDEKILQIAGTKARAMEKYNFLPSLSDFDATEVQLSVNVGIGAVDPMQQLGKLRMAASMLAPLVPLFIEQGIELNGEAWIGEIMGKAGYKDGRRFFNFGEKPQKGKSLEQVKLEQEKELKSAELDQELVMEMLELLSKEKIDANDNLTKLEIADKAGLLDLTALLVGAAQGRETQAHDVAQAQVGREHEVDQTREGRSHDVEQGNVDFARGFAEKRASAQDETKRRIGEALAQRAAEGNKTKPKSGGSKPMGNGNSSSGDSAHHALMAHTANALTKIMDRLEAMAAGSSASTGQPLTGQMGVSPLPSQQPPAPPGAGSGL